MKNSDVVVLNPNVHLCLLAEGYEHLHYPAEFDDGDPENGPGTWGCPAFDEYTCADDHIVIDDKGKFVHCEARDHELESWIDSFHCHRMED